MEICTFSTFTDVPQNCFASNFLCVHFFKNFSNFEAKRAKTGAKNQKNVLSKCVLFRTHRRVCVLSFQKKVKFAEPY
jgi:hypothetical protein